jgi:hypothetical protein
MSDINMRKGEFLMGARLATAPESRESLKIAVSMANHRVRFVSIPTLDDEDHERMLSLSMTRFDSLIDRCDAEGNLPPTANSSTTKS